jgi:hypothetical protein
MDYKKNLKIGNVYKVKPEKYRNFLHLCKINYFHRNGTHVNVDWLIDASLRETIPPDCADCKDYFIKIKNLEEVIIIKFDEKFHNHPLTDMFIFKDKNKENEKKS